MLNYFAIRKEYFVNMRCKQSMNTPYYESARQSQLTRQEMELQKKPVHTSSPQITMVCIITLFSEKNRWQLSLAACAAFLLMSHLKLYRFYFSFFLKLLNSKQLKVLISMLRDICCVMGTAYI